MGLTNHLSCFHDAFSFLSRFFFLNDESDNYGSGSGSSGTCAFPFCSGNYVGRVSGICSGVFVPTGIKSISDVISLVVFVPRGVESKVGRLIEIFSRSKY